LDSGAGLSLPEICFSFVAAASVNPRKTLANARGCLVQLAHGFPHLI
jgi:hypothetical protein